MKSNSNYQFSQVPAVDMPRSVFNRSRGYKTTLNADLLYPFFVDEALPGDTFNVRGSVFARLNPIVAPIMDNLYADVFFFAVPERILWDNWERFNGSQSDPGDSTDYLVPQLVFSPQTGVNSGSLGDYFGLPVGVGGLSVRAAHFRAYNLIWNEFFRDENLQDSVDVPLTDGPDTESQYRLLPRGKRHDYFTSCLPWPQKGPGVELPLGGVAPVITGAARTIASAAPTGDALRFRHMDNGTFVANGDNALVMERITGQPSTVGQAFTRDVLQDPVGGRQDYVAPVNLYADLSVATAATINSLRQAFQIQRLLERDARGGTRYIEILKSHFGVTSPDFRLQRPEYLGGTSIPVSILANSQTSSTDSTTPQGNLAANGVFGKSGIGFNKSFVEHSVIIGLISIRADLTYQQGLNRMWSRRTRWDYYWPTLAHLGEQAVLNKEIYCQFNAQDDEVFGYQERWAEYRYAPSMITGKLRSNIPDTLEVWHLSQNFASLPALNADFIRERVPLNRVLALPQEPAFVFDSQFDVRCARPMPLYSVPGLIDHF